MTQITVNTPHPKTRTEAWAAWEAAVLANLGVVWEAKQSPHTKKFNIIMKRRKLFLFAREISPNRGEIVVDLVSGPEKRINIMARYVLEERSQYSNFRINKELYPEYRARQDKLIAQGRKITTRLLLGDVNIDLIKMVYVVIWTEVYASLSDDISPNVTDKIRVGPVRTKTVQLVGESGEIKETVIDKDAEYFVEWTTDVLSASRALHFVSEEAYVAYKKANS